MVRAVRRLAALKRARGCLASRPGSVVSEAGVVALLWSYTNDSFEIRSDVHANPAANIAFVLLLKIGQSSAVWPVFRAAGNPMAARKVGAVDQDSAYTFGSHFANGDLLSTVSHC